jgi:hypothetical protein
LYRFERRENCDFRYSGGMQEETAPPFESWEEHLEALADRDLAQLAKDYRWLDEEARAQEERADFRRRRESIIAECERRGMSELAAECRRPAMGGSGR